MKKPITYNLCLNCIGNTTDISDVSMGVCSKCNAVTLVGYLASN